MLFQDLQEVDKYDAIWACSSILHFPYAELVDVINKISIALKEKGFIYTSFKYEIYEGVRNGRYFTDMKETTFDEKICNAWYSVHEFHIHLSGIQADGLERVVLLLTELSDFPANASKVVIKNAIKEHNVEWKTYKEQLTNMVPHRALAGFFDKIDETVDWSSIRRLTTYIERINRNIVLLPYTLGEESKLENKVYFQDAWVERIRDQTVAIFGWIQYEKVKWL